MLLGRVGLVLFNDNWSQYGHSVSHVRMTILFLKLQITTPATHKVGCQLVIVYGHFKFYLPQRLHWGRNGGIGDSDQRLPT